MCFKKPTSVNILECVIIIDVRQNMNEQLCIQHHLSSLFGEQDLVSVWLEVTAPRPLVVSCSCSSPACLVIYSRRGSVVTNISGLYSFGRGAFCPQLVVPFSDDGSACFLSVWHIGVAWQLCAKQSFNFSAPGQWKREALFRKNLRKILLLLVCSNYQCAKHPFLPIEDTQQHFI